MPDEIVISSAESEVYFFGIEYLPPLGNVTLYKDQIECLIIENAVRGDVNRYCVLAK
jgi:hypothetical protein